MNMNVAIFFFIEGRGAVSSVRREHTGIRIMGHNSNCKWLLFVEYLLNVGFFKLQNHQKLVIHLLKWIFSGNKFNYFEDLGSEDF